MKSHKSVKKLRELIGDFFFEDTLSKFKSSILDQPVHEITQDSRKAGPGVVFVAINGVSKNGHEFIQDALKKGVAFVIGEEGLSVPSDRYLQVPDSKLLLADLAASFYDYPSKELQVYGVTGTSGKTTTTYLLESIFKAAGHKVAVLGTVNFRFNGRVEDSTHTTPDAISVQALLAHAIEESCDVVIMEVSSHALKQKRVAAVAFDGMIFTNLSREHLDYHPDMEDYFESKAILFSQSVEFAKDVGKNPAMVVNADDAYGKRLLASLKSAGERSFGFGRSPAADFSGRGLVSDFKGIHGTVSGVDIQSPLIGEFNVENILGAVALAHKSGISGEEIHTGLKSLKSVAGRLERVENSKGVHVLVDYAHKPDALEKVLKCLSQIENRGKLITVFGCGGDRDRTKRPVMGKISLDHSDHVIVTSDNPRTEEPMKIIHEITDGMGNSKKFEIIPDRKKAIGQAISISNKGDVVLIAGKGHEDYQIIAAPGKPGGTEKIHFDDREVADLFLKSKP